MAITLVGSAGALNNVISGTQNNQYINVPSTVQANDLLIIAGYQTFQSYCALGSPYVLLDSITSYGAVYYRIADSSTASTTIGLASNNYFPSAILLVYRGVNTTTPIESHNLTNFTGSPTTWSAPSITPTNSGDASVIFLGTYSSYTPSVGSGYQTRISNHLGGDTVFSMDRLSLVGGVADSPSGTWTGASAHVLGNIVLTTATPTSGGAKRHRMMV